MITYPHRLTIAVPESLTAKANQLALVIGESQHDDQTFTQCNYQDANGNLYAVASTAVKEIILIWLYANELPSNNPNWSNPFNADLTQAHEAFDAVNQGQIMIRVGDDAQVAIADMGLTLIPSEEEI